MGTKWKNRIEYITQLWGKNLQILFGTILPAGGLLSIWIMLEFRGNHSSRNTLFFGVMGNLLLGTGLWRLLSLYLNRRYGEPEESREYDYEKWKESRDQSRKRLYRIGKAGSLPGIVYLLVDAAIMYMGGWWYNYAPGYVIIITALLQFLICQRRVNHFWEQRLDCMMDQMEAMQQKRLAEALEIEKKSLEKVSRSDQLRVDLITNVSHDLKTPLTSIVGYLELLKKEELSDAVRDYVDVISARTQKLGEMINSLFSLAKASSGNVELHREQFEVNRLIEQIFADMDDRIRESGLKFVTQLTKENTEIHSDNMYFYRICQNLIENALKYSAENTRVFVKTFIKRTEPGDGDAQGDIHLIEIPDSVLQKVSFDQPTEQKEKICIEITNTAGYDMDFTKEDIIERFARGDQSRTSEGNGLGLAIVSTYVKALGGEFDIRIDCDQFKACLEF